MGEPAAAGRVVQLAIPPSAGQVFVERRGVFGQDGPVAHRNVGDPWYTALYRDPAGLWWVPPVTGGAIMLAGWLFVRAVIGTGGWVTPLGIAGAVSVIVGLPMASW